MHNVASTFRSLIVMSICALAISGGDLRPPIARAQPAATAAPPGQEVDLAPWENSGEVRELVGESAFVPDAGEPAGAVRAYLATTDKIRTAMRRIGVGKLPGEPDFDPEQLLNEAFVTRRQTTALYPTSRHAWEGLGDVLWLRYRSKHKTADLREGIEAYERAADLLVKHGSPAGLTGRDFFNLAASIATGHATLSDHAGLDTFVQKVKATEFWDLVHGSYAVALGALNDARADQTFRDVLASVPPGATLPIYVDYLIDQHRYQDALQIMDRQEPSTLSHVQRAIRGAILERVGRAADARAEYQHYLGAVRSSPFGPGYSLPDRYRIPGSTLQRGMKFRASEDALPKPQSRLWQWLLPTPAWASHVSDPCALSDWICKAVYYLDRTIAGEAGCVNTDPGCIGTVGGQRAVAWNIRTRVFWGRGSRTCFGATQVCFNYAFNYQLGAPSDFISLAKRYYFVIDTGMYRGLEKPLREADRLEAEAVLNDVVGNGNVPDPIVGACYAGFPTGDVCSARCTAAAGTWGSFAANQSGPEFRGSQVVWQGGTNTTCSWEALVPISTPTGSACGTQCFVRVGTGAVCPKYGWLRRTSGCVGSQPYEWAPKWGNFYWRFLQ